jgi:hypothetical protein
MMTLGVIELIVASFPMILSIAGIYFKMNNLIIRQDVKIQNLEKEIKEMKRHNERTEEKMFEVLEIIKSDLTDIKVHFSSCINFKTNK